MEGVRPSNDGLRKRPAGLRPAPFYVILEWATLRWEKSSSMTLMEQAMILFGRGDIEKERELHSDCCAVMCLFGKREWKMREFSSEEKLRSTLEWRWLGWGGWKGGGYTSEICSLLRISLIDCLSFVFSLFISLSLLIIFFLDGNRNWNSLVNIYVHEKCVRSFWGCFDYICIDDGYI